MQKFQAAFLYNREILVSNVFSGFHCFCDVKEKNGLKKKKKKLLALEKKCSRNLSRDH